MRLVDAMPVGPYNFCTSAMSRVFAGFIHAIADWVEPVLTILGVLGGVVFGCLILCADKTWFDGNNGWQIDAFAAFGAMSGFALASLALVASLSAHPRAQEVIDSGSGRYLLRCLVFSMWTWLLPGLLALLDIAYPSRWVEAGFVALTVVAVARGLISLFAISLFFKRFTVPIHG